MGWYQPHVPLTPSKIDLTGQTVAVTGATAGLGYESSLQLLRLKAGTLIMGVRNTSKGNEARERLLADSEVKKVNPQAKVKVFKLDLVDEKSVVSFANRVLKEESRLDILLLNAGINLAAFQTSPTGHEMYIFLTTHLSNKNSRPDKANNHPKNRLMQVNYYSNALLSLLLLPLLSKTSQQSQKSTNPHLPKITWVGSLAQGFNSLSKFPLHTTPHILPYFDDPNVYSRFSRYPDSKMLVAMFVREMAKHVPSTSVHGKGGVVINNLCPGTVDTAADNNLPFYMRLPMNWNRKLRARTVEEGARTLVFAAAVVGWESHGGYISSNEISP